MVNLCSQLHKFSLEDVGPEGPFLDWRWFRGAFDRCQMRILFFRTSNRSEPGVGRKGYRTVFSQSTKGLYVYLPRLGRWSGGTIYRFNILNLEYTVYPLVVCRTTKEIGTNYSPVLSDLGSKTTQYNHKIGTSVVPFPTTKRLVHQIYEILGSPSSGEHHRQKVRTT